MGLKSFVRSLFGRKSPRSWNESPESFLAFVLYLQQKNSGFYDELELLQWGTVMMKVMNVKLAPYKDFGDLLKRGTPDYSLVEKMSEQLHAINKRIELKKAIYGKDVDLGDDDIMTSNTKESIAAREFVEDLSKYVQFTDETKPDRPEE